MLFHEHCRLVRMQTDGALVATEGNQHISENANQLGYP